MTPRLPVLFCLLFLITGIRGQNDFDLSDAFDSDPTVNPTTKEDIRPRPTTKPTDPKPATSAPKADPKPATSAPKADPKPATSAPKPDPKPDDGFDLNDAVGGHDATPTKKPQPGHGGGGGAGGGSFGDFDLGDGHANDPSESDGHQGAGGNGQGEAPEKQGVIAGVLSALGVAAVGAVTSFVAYQKKKLCFKGQGEDPENVNMDHQKDQSDPQPQTNLLAK